MALTQFAFGSLYADVPAFVVAGSQVDMETQTSLEQWLAAKSGVTL